MCYNISIMLPRNYLIALIVTAVIIFGGAFLLIRSFTGGNEPDKKPEQTNQQQQATPAPKKLKTDARSVTLIVQGELVGEEARRSIRTTITQSERRVEVLQGYDEAVAKTQATANKQSAYDAFITAIEQAGFTSKNKENTQDFLAACPNGKKFVYRVTYVDNTTDEAWSSTCSKQGNFTGNDNLIRSLFESQIPEYKKFVSGVRLG